MTAGKRGEVVRKAVRISAVVLVAMAAGNLLPAEPAPAQVFTETPAPRAAPKPAPKPKPKPRSSSTSQRKASVTQPPAPPVVRSYNDPALYCQANPTVDIPAAPYAGPAVPDWVAGAVVPAGKARNSGAIAWRCLSGRVFACFDGTGLGTCTKPDQSVVATEELTRFCEGKRNAKVPDTVVPHAVPVWACRKGKPEVTGYRGGLDSQGYFADNWRDVTGYAPGNMLGAVPRVFVGDWVGKLNAKGFIFKRDYAVAYQIKGGAVGAQVGEIGYYSYDLQGQLQLMCGAILSLRSANADALVLDEMLATEVREGACPVQGHVTMRMVNNRLSVEWRKKADDKVRQSGEADRVKK